MPAYSINCRGKLLDFSGPKVMGILNLTPDSFFDGQRYQQNSAYMTQCEQMIQEGVSIIDVGGQSTRPNASRVSSKEEAERILPAIREIRRAFPDLILSVDTFYGEVARSAANEGVDIINDVSGGAIDPDMFATVAELNLPYVLMNMNGMGGGKPEFDELENPMPGLIKFLSAKIYQLRKAGVKDIIIDPGFGFGKSLTQNYQIMQSLWQLEILDCPILIGVSRKSMINKLLEIKASQALNATTVLNTIGLLNGAKILRVHDVREAMEAIKIVSFAQSV